MRKIALVLAVLLFASPVFAGVVIECTAVSDVVTVSYDTNDLDPNLIRAVALDVNVDNGAIIASVSDFDPCYGIYPGSIDINDTNGNIDASGSAVCDPYEYGDTLGGVGTAGMTIEMGSLYVGAPNAPGSTGDLFKFVVDLQGADDCNVTIALNSSRGGVVMEDTAVAANALLKGCSPTAECYAGQADYSEWVDANKPECWCYSRQCHGDADGKKQGNSYTGYYYVGTDDIDIVSLGWKVLDIPKGPGILNLTVNGVPVACADFDHGKQGNSYTGYYRIGTDDIDIMSLYWKVLEPTKGPGTPADCQPGNRTPL